MANPSISVNISADSTALMGELNKMSAGVKAATDKLSGSFSGVGSTLDALKGPVMALAGIFGGGALFGSAIKDTIDFSKEITKLSNLFGISKQQATVLQIAIGDIFGDSDTFMAGAGKFTKVLASNEERITQLTGVRTRDNGQLRNGLTVMLEVLQGMDKYKAGIDKNIVAQELFGKSFKDMLKYAQLTTSVMLDAEEKVNKLGLAFGYVSDTKIKAYRDAQNELEDSFLAMKKNITVELVPSLTNLGNLLANMMVPITKVLVPLVNGFTSALSMTSVQLALGAVAVLGMVKALGSLAIITKIIEYYKVYASLAKLEGVMIGLSNVKAFGAALYTAIGPIGIAIGVVTALAVAFEYLANQEKRAAENAKAVTEGQIERAEAMKTFAEQAKAKFDILNDKNQTDKNKEQAKDVLKSEIDAFNIKWKAAFDYNQLVKMSYEDQKKFADSLNSDARNYAAQSLEDKKKQLQAKKDAYQSTLGTTVTEGDGDATTVHVVTQAEIDASIKGDKLIVQLNKDVEELTKAKSKLFDPKVAETTRAKVKNTMEGLEAELEQSRKNAATKLGSEDAANYKLSLEAIRDFWKIKLASAAKGSDDHKAVLAKYTASEEALRNDNLKNLEANYNAETVAAGSNLALKKQITEKYYKDALRDYDKHGELTKKLAIALGKDEEAIKKDHSLVMLEMDKGLIDSLIQDNNIAQSELQAKETAGLISKAETYKQWKKLELDKMDLELILMGIEKDRADAENGAGSSQSVKITNQINALAAAKQALMNQADPNQVTNGISDGMLQFKNNFMSTAQQLKSAVFSIFSGLQSTLNSTLMGLMTGQIKAGMALQTIWKGLGTTVAGEISKMISAKIASWVVDKAISAWDSINTKQKIAEKGAKTGANVVEGVSGFWASLSPMGWVGVILAGLAVAAMLASISSVGGDTGGGGGSAAQPTPYSDRGTGLQFTGRAIGGLITRPEFTLMGEEGPEVIAPVQGFKEYSLQLMAESINSFGSFMTGRQAAIGNYSAMSSQFATAGGNGKASSGVTLHLGSNNVFAEGAEKQLYKMLENYNRNN